MNLTRDVPQVLALLNLVFSASLRRRGRQSLRGASLTQHSWLTLRLRHLWQGIVPGFVWEASGTIVGNASLLTSAVEGRFLVANVAVHPDFRRQGIGRMLMEAVVDYVRQRGASEILLQVKRDNHAAINLYKTQGFGIVGSMTAWSGSSKSLSLPVVTSGHRPDGYGDTYIRPLRNDEWREAWMLDCVSVEPNLNWPEPLPIDAYRQTWWDKVSNLLNGRRSEAWIAEQRDHDMAGLGIILSQWGSAHTLRLRIHPRWQGELERELLAKLFRRLRYLPVRNVRLDHPADDEATNMLLRQAGLRERRTLTTMRMEL